MILPMRLIGLFAGKAVLVAVLVLNSQRSLGAADAKTEWHRIVIAGKSAGYTRITDLPRPEGGFQVDTYMKLVLARGAVKLEIEEVNRVREDADGKIVDFLTEQKMSRQTMVVKGRVEGDVLKVTTTAAGAKPRESEVPFDSRTVGPHQAEQILKTRLRKEGDEVELVVFIPQPQALRCTKQKAVLGPVEEVSLPSGRRRLHRMDVQLEIFKDNVISHWIGEDHKLWKTQMDVMGLPMITYRSTREEILSEDFSSPPEIFISSSIKVKRPVPPGARDAVYRLTRKHGEFTNEQQAKLVAAAGQKLVRRESGRAIVIRVQSVNPSAKGRKPAPEGDTMRPYLEPNAFLQSDDPAVVKIAREATGNEKDTWRSAKLLEQWVYDNVREKNMHTAFATAKEVVDAREGDCTEHAVLLAALARAAGIPARVVVGLVHSNSAFFGHMWTEVYTGEWVPLDATRGRGRVGPDHIALATSSLGTESISEIFLGLISILGNLEIEVVEVN